MLFFVLLSLDIMCEERRIHFGKNLVLFTIVSSKDKIVRKYPNKVLSEREDETSNPARNQPWHAGPPRANREEELGRLDRYGKSKSYRIQRSISAGLRIN
jgi:hypothetical protein